MLKWIIKVSILLLLVSLISVLIIVKYIPSVVDSSDTDEPVFHEFLIKDNNVKIFADFESDLTSFHGYEYDYDGKDLYIKLYAHLYLLHCKKGEGLGVKINMNGDFENLQNIYIKDNEKSRKIWSKNES